MAEPGALGVWAAQSRWKSRSSAAAVAAHHSTPSRAACPPSSRHYSETFSLLTDEKLSTSRHSGLCLRELGDSRGSSPQWLPPEMSNFYCHPGRAGGTPLRNRGPATDPLCEVDWRAYRSSREGQLSSIQRADIKLTFAGRGARGTRRIVIEHAWYRDQCEE